MGAVGGYKVVAAGADGVKQAGVADAGCRSGRYSILQIKKNLVNKGYEKNSLETAEKAQDKSYCAESVGY